MTIEKSGGEVISDQELESVARAIDQVTVSFNRALTVPQHFSNAYKLKTVLGSRQLPILETLINGMNEDEAERLLQLADESRESARNQAHQVVDDQPESKAEIVNRMLDVFELYVLTMHEGLEEVTSGTIKNAWIEMASLTPNNPLWVAVSKRKGPNLIDGNESFSPEFRTNNGFN